MGSMVDKAVDQWLLDWRRGMGSDGFSVEQRV